MTRQDLAGWSFTSGVSHYTLAGPPGADACARTYQAHVLLFASLTCALTLYPTLSASAAGWDNSADDGLPAPHPDWFTAVLWRQLVGSRVLSSTLSTNPASVNNTLAVHAWCAATSAGPVGSVVLLFINVAPAPVALSLSGALSPSPRVEFILSAPSGNMTADAVLLNDTPLGVDGTGRLAAQPIPGKTVPAGGAGLSLPSQSYGFVVLQAAAASACSV